MEVKLLNKKIHPKNLFLIDAIGALLSFILLRFILTSLEHYFGIPKDILYFLAWFPFFFIIYDLVCYTINTKKIGALLKGIAFMNISYCILSLITILSIKENITILGWFYILGEVFLVCILAYVEYKTKAL